MVKAKIILRIVLGLGVVLICSESSCTPVGYHDSPVIGPGSTKWVRTGWTLKTTREERLEFEQEVKAKVDSFIRSHHDLRDLEKEALRKGRVVPGMTKQQVALLLGKPFQILTSPEKLPGRAKDKWVGSSSIDEAWLYRVASSRFNNAVAVIYYDDDRVVSLMEYGHYYLLP